MTRLHLIGLSILTGVLLSLGWPAIGDFSPVLFLAFVPLLFVEHHLDSSRSFRWYPLLAFTTFNVLTTWFVYCVSEDFATKLFVFLAAVVVNSLVMTLVFSLFHYTKKHLGERRGYIALIVYWMAFEYFHLNWELTWPWLHLGNGFANQVTWIQWYEYTGTFGGTLWILLTNVLIFVVLKRAMYSGIELKGNRVPLITIVLLLLTPIAISKYIYATYEELERPIRIAIVQPNIDPYDEKYFTSGDEQLDKMLTLIEDGVKGEVDYLLAPETALSGDIREHELEDAPAVRKIKSFLEDRLKSPSTEFVAGMSSWRILNEDNLTNSAREFRDGGGHYDVYNAAIQIRTNPAPDIRFGSQVYHKSKLVQGVEKMPFASLLKPLENFALDMGGTTGSLGSQEESSIFKSGFHKISIAPVICYESIYGEYVASYVKKGAHLIFIMTNDGWWEDTPGYKQHLAYARLRAIENRRSVARSANTGISCFINQRGDIISSTSWWTAEVLEGTLNANFSYTLYTRAGNYLARISSFLAVALLVFAFVNSRKAKALPNL